MMCWENRPGPMHELNKMTYPAVHGMPAAMGMVKELTTDALASLNILQRETPALRDIALYLMNRDF